MLRKCRWSFALVAFALLFASDATTLRAQSYLQNAGVPSFTSQSPVERGFINLANGNLHLEIPLGSFPQRGGGVDKIALIYDSTIWLNAGGGWAPWNISDGGWRLVTSGDTGGVTFGDYESDCSSVYGPFIWSASDGTQHVFPISTSELYCGGDGTHSGSAYASDGSGFYLSITDDLNAQLYAPDGTLSAIPWVVVPSTKTDPNGNQYNFSISGLTETYTDTLGRTVVSLTFSSDYNTWTIAIPNAQGSTSTYTVNLSTVNVSSNFGQSGISEYAGPIQAITGIDLPDGTSYSFTYDSGTSSGHYGLLSSMTLPTGGTINYTASNFTDSYGNTGRWVTGRTTPDSSTPWSYTPAGISSCSSSQVNCQQKVTVTKPSGDYAVYTFTLNGGAWPTAVQYEDSSSTVLASTSVCYNFGSCPYSVTTASPATNVYRTATTTTLPSGSVSTTTEYTWDSSNNGNLVQIAEWNFGNSPSSSADRTTAISYYSAGYVINRPSTITVTDYTTSTTIAKIVNSYDGSSLVTSGATGVAQHDDTDYGSGFSARGNLTQVQRYTSSSGYLTSSMTYDITGQVRTSIDPVGNETVYSYSDAFYTDPGDGSSPSTYSPSTTTNAYLTSVTRAYGTSVAETATFGYYWGTGQTAKSTDPNSQTTYSHFYDVLSRPTSISFPDGGLTSFSYPDDVTVGITEKIDGSHNRVSYLKRDGIGREIRRETSNGEPSNWDDQTDTCFDQNGRIGFQSYPYQGSGFGSSPICSNSTGAGDAFGYDGLDRVTSITHSDGSAAYFGRPGNCLQAWDEKGNMRQACTNSRGQTTQVTEDPGGTGHLNYVTNYSYDGLENLRSVSQSSSRSRSFYYDWLGRPTSTTDPESGTVNYYYTTSGGSLCSGDAAAVCRRTDARSITATYSYDALNRVTLKSYSDGTPSAYYFYDADLWSAGLTNVVGRLAGEATYNGSWLTTFLFGYDSMGRVNLNDQWNAYGSGPLTFSYNLIGGITSYANGAGVTLNQSPSASPINAAGRITAITSSWSDSTHPGTLVSGLHYNAVGALNVGTLANGLTETAFYNSLLQPCRSNTNSSSTSLTSCGASIPSGNIQDFSFGFNAGSGDNGNLASITGTGNQGFGRSYTYDNVNRLLTMSAPSDPSGCTGLSWSYDTWGNRLTQTTTGGTCNSWSASYSTANQPTTSGFTFDAAGNMTHDASHSYTYDAENQLICVDGGSTPSCTSGSATAIYLYDALGHRVRKSTGGVTTDYVYDLTGNVLAEMQGGSMSTGYVYLNGQLLSLYTGGTTEFVHADHLSSSRLVTSLSGSVVDSMDYLPFGEQVGGSSATSHKFTGQERDSESNLDNFIARYYSSAQGHFMSPDPLGGNLGDPQSLNRYAYVRNNPLTFTDPTGMQFGDDDGGDCEDVCLEPVYDSSWNPPPPATDEPANAGIQPNPPAGDPDPNGAFSGPIWQEGGPQIAPDIFGLFLPSDSGCEFGSCFTHGSGNSKSSWWNWNNWQWSGIAGIRRSWERYFGQPWPKEPSGANYQAHHITYRSEGGGNEPTNIEPKTKADHIEFHRQQGDFVRWGRQGGLNRWDNGNPVVPGRGPEEVDPDLLDDPEFFDWIP